MIKISIFESAEFQRHEVNYKSKSILDLRFMNENLICNDLVNNTMSAEQSSKTAEGINRWKCEICGKSFDNVDMLNYHNLLEHSEHKRPPIGIG